MAHHTIKSSYAKLTERLNKFPQGAPPSETLDAILKIIIKEKEAELISKLPILYHQGGEQSVEAERVGIAENS